MHKNYFWFTSYIFAKMYKEIVHISIITKSFKQVFLNVTKLHTKNNYHLKSTDDGNIYIKHILENILINGGKKNCKICKKKITKYAKYS